MRVYVGGKYARAEEARRVMDLLRAHGHTITLDWTEQDVTGLAGQELRMRMIRIAGADFDAVMEAEAFVLLHDDACRGGFVEFGIALGQGKLMAVIGGRTKAPHRAPIFYALPEVQHFESAEAVVEWLDFLDEGFRNMTYEQIVEASR